MKKVPGEHLVGKRVSGHTLDAKGFHIVSLFCGTRDLSYMGTKKSEPPMWPAVDHIHILGDLRLPGVNEGRAIQTC